MVSLQSNRNPKTTRKRIGAIKRKQTATLRRRNTATQKKIKWGIRKLRSRVNLKTGREHMTYVKYKRKQELGDNVNMYNVCHRSDLGRRRRSMGQRNYS